MSIVEETQASEVPETDEESKMLSTGFTNLRGEIDPSLIAQILEPAFAPQEGDTPERVSAGDLDNSDNDLTPPKKNNYMYMGDSDEGENYGYPDKDDYYPDYGEGEIDLEEEDEEMGSGEDDFGEQDHNAIDQLKKVFMQMKDTGSNKHESDEKYKTKKEERKKQKPLETPKHKGPNTKKYREDEEKAPFTPL